MSSQSGYTATTSGGGHGYGPGGMPQSRFQSSLDDMLVTQAGYSIQEEQQMPPPSLGPSRPLSRAGGRTSTMSSFSRRVSTSSMASGRNGSGLFGWKKRGGNASGVEFEEEEDGAGDTLVPGIGDTPDISMGDLSALRDRERYPTMSGRSTPGGANSNEAINNSGRTMSISSNMSSAFDSAPIIPMIRGNPSRESMQSSQYRKNLTQVRKQALRSSDSVVQQQHLQQQQQQQQQHQQYLQQQYIQQQHQQQYRSMAGGAPPVVTQYQRFPPPQSAGIPGGGYPRTMSMNGYPPPVNTSYGVNGSPVVSDEFRRVGSAGSTGSGVIPTGPINPAIALPQPRSALMVSTATMTDPELLADITASPPSFGSQASVRTMVDSSTTMDDDDFDDYEKRQSGTATGSTRNSGVEERKLNGGFTHLKTPFLPPISPIMTPSSTSPVRDASEADGVKGMVLQTNDDELQELRVMNKRLLDEIRLVTGELADSIRRELGMADDTTTDEKELKEPTANSAAKLSLQLVKLEEELELERRKRLAAESIVHNFNTSTRGIKDEEDNGIHVFDEKYKKLELERELSNQERLLANEKQENQALSANVAELTKELESLQIETQQLKTGLLPELRAHVEDLEVLTAAGNPIELLKQVEDLKVDNVKMTRLLEENSTRGPLGEKIKAVEEQRDTLREALRSLRERKDHEVRETKERVQQLESKLEKERVVSAQMQRRLMSQRNFSGASLTSLNNNSTTTINGSNTVSNLDLGGPVALSYNATGVSSGTSSPKNLEFSRDLVSPTTSSGFSAVNVEISHEPTWLEYAEQLRRRE